MARGRRQPIGIGVLAAALLAAGLVTWGQTVPPAYTDLYNSLKTSLDAYEAILDQRLPPSSGPVVYATELLVANCNRGEALLRPGTMDSVKLCLDRFQAMGIVGVTVAVHYPLFDPAFPSHDEYVTFYKAMAEEIHRRGMILDVESHVVFTDTPFSPIHWDWSHYTVASLAAARRAMAQIILEQVRPDYLNLGTESDTEAKLTGLVALRDPATYASFIGTIAGGLDKGITKVGAGMGAWDDIRQAEYLAQIPSLDVLTLHVYDLNPQSLQNSLAIGDVARTNGKGLILDEAWLYKMGPGDGNDIASNAEVFKRDAFSFFAPLDRRMLRCMAKLAQVDGMEFVSPFWSTYFFAYLDYTPALDNATYEEVSSQVTLAEWQAIQAGTRDATGDFYASLIARAPVDLSADFTTSPALPTDAALVTFSASASGGTAPYTFTWDLDGAPATGETASKSFPAGDHQVTLTVKDAAGGTAQESKTVTVVAAPRIASLAKLSNPLRLKITGSNFQAGCSVTINGAAVPQTDRKGDTLVYAKQGGALKAMLPKGVTVQVAVVNPDGTASAPVAFTR